MYLYEYLGENLVKKVSTAALSGIFDREASSIQANPSMDWMINLHYYISSSACDIAEKNKAR